MTLENDILFLDQDDTTIDSTATIHWPAYVEIVKQLRPNIEPLDLESFYLINFHNSLMKHYLDSNYEFRGVKSLNFNEDDMNLATDVWREYTMSIVPPFFDGIIESLQEYQNKGGKIIIVSHSEPHIIKSRYKSDGRIEPLYIFGHVNGERDKNKPNPYPVFETKRRLNDQMSLEKSIVVDDLRPGIDMATNAGIKSAIAGWGGAQKIPEIKNATKELTDIYFDTVKEFKDYILKEK